MLHIRFDIMQVFPVLASGVDAMARLTGFALPSDSDRQDQQQQQLFDQQQRLQRQQEQQQQLQQRRKDRRGL